MVTPRFFAKHEGSLRCLLCPSRCIIPAGNSGHCGVRFNHEGKGNIPFYGFVSALAQDPIEKKPLYHFRPGTQILSVGFTGCNMHCPFCQNWSISQTTDVSGKVYSPAEIIAAAAGSIAYTYSEPLVHVEFLLDCMKLARKAGIANVLVSNGCINADAAEEILDLCDAANIDLKCFSADTYSNVLGGNLEAVTNFTRTAAAKNVHLELTTLLVPTLNDSRAELDKCRDFIAELETEKGNSIPWHISAYHPDFKWNRNAKNSPPVTDQNSIIAAVKRAREKLPFVYAGNLALLPAEQNFNDTLCTYCGKALVRRYGFKADLSSLVQKRENKSAHYSCVFCGEKAAFIKELSPWSYS